jgi:hypothetical protein
MRHRITPLIVLFAALACSGDAGPEGDPLDPAFARVPDASWGGRGITVTLSGDQESTPNASDATGTFHMTLNPGLDKLCYHLTATGLEGGNLTGAHVHKGDVGVAGPVRVPLAVPTGGESGGCVDIADELLWDIWENPEDFYVNVHTQTYPAGEIRAQLGS